MTNEIFWLYYLEQFVILHSSNLNTYRHNFSISATLFQLMAHPLARIEVRRWGDSSGKFCEIMHQKLIWALFPKFLESRKLYSYQGPIARARKSIALSVEPNNYMQVHLVGKNIIKLRVSFPVISCQNQNWK